MSTPQREKKDDMPQREIRSYSVRKAWFDCLVTSRTYLAFAHVGKLQKTPFAAEIGILLECGRRALFVVPQMRLMTRAEIVSQGFAVA